MKTDWRYYTLAGIVALLALSLIWRLTLGRDAAAPTVSVPAGSNPQSETPPELPGNVHTAAPPTLAR